MADHRQCGARSWRRSPPRCGRRGDAEQRRAACSGRRQAYPAQSDIRPVNTRRSTSRQHPEAANPVDAELTIAVTYTYDTFGPIATDPIELAIDHHITVHQLQAVIRH